MATIQFKKGEDYIFKLAALEAAAKDQLFGNAIYGAAAIVADDIRTELEKIPTDNTWGTHENPTSGPNSYQKEGLMRSLGITHMQNDGNGFLNVKIGFDGYNGLTSFRWRNGQPNNMIARSVERGTSWMKANPFVKKAVARSKKRALEFMKNTIEFGIEAIMNGKE